jgi:hypothetical protein
MEQDKTDKVEFATKGEVDFLWREIQRQTKRMLLSSILILITAISYFIALAKVKDNCEDACKCRNNQQDQINIKADTLANPLLSFKCDACEHNPVIRVSIGAVVDEPVVMDLPQDIVHFSVRRFLSGDAGIIDNDVFILIPKLPDYSEPGVSGLNEPFLI